MSHDSGRGFPHDSGKRLPPDSARGFPPDPGCDDLRPDLFLYAEGELRCPSSLLRIRRHLRGCSACQDRLAEHDAVTRAILAAGLLEDLPIPGGSRADRIMDLIGDLGPLQEPAAASSGAGCAPFLEVPAPRRPGRIAQRVAAALVVTGLLAAFAAFSSTSRDFHDRLAGRGKPARPASRAELASLVGDPATNLAGPHGTAAAPGAVGERILWLALPRDRALEALPPEFPVRLLGFRPVLHGLPDDGMALEWMVEALVDARPSSGTRFFLVPEGSDVTAIEIAPRSCIGRRQVVLHLPDLRGRPIETQRAYRIYVLDDPCSLGGAAPERLLGSSPPIFSGLVHGAAPREWVFPARWKN